MQEQVSFGDILKDGELIYHYYLFYDVGANHTFHTPIDEDEVDLYNLPIVDIDQLQTTGYDVTELLSNQFVKKVIALIQSDDYKLVENI